MDYNYGWMLLIQPQLHKMVLQMFQSGEINQLMDILLSKIQVKVEINRRLLQELKIMCHWHQIKHW